MFSVRSSHRLRLRRCQSQILVSRQQQSFAHHPPLGRREGGALCSGDLAGWTLLQNDDENSQRRHYHTTPKNEMVLYGTIILVTTLGYVAYKKYNGEPIKPRSATESQSMYQNLEEDRLRRNEKYYKKLGGSSKETKN
jgi:hypothetical protein